MRSLHRFPVKSMSGEERNHLDVDARGCVGDRVWSVRTADGKIGSGKNTRRFAAVPGLLELRAEERNEACLGVIATVETPGRIAPGDPVLLG